MGLGRGVLIPLLVPFSWLLGEDLQPGHPIDRQLAAGLADEYAIHLEAGQFMHIVVQQMGVDVVVAIRDPQGKVIVEADRPNGFFGPEAVSFIASAAGEFRVNVKNPSSAPGPYRIESFSPHPPTGADRQRIEAERALFEAARGDLPPTREARLHSVELYQRALTIWHTLPDAYEEGLTLYGIASRYDDLEDEVKAFEYCNQALPVRRAAGDRSGEADTLNLMAAVYESRGDNQKALDFYSQSREIRRGLHDAFN